MSLHIGQKIKEIAEKLNIGPSELGRRIHSSRQNVRGIFNRETIDTGLLLRISEALQHNFFQYYYREASKFGGDDFLSRVEEKQVEYQSKLDNMETKLSTVEKELALTKKINALLEEKVGK